MFKRKVSLFIILLSLIACNNKKESVAYGVIPMPQKIENNRGEFSINASTQIFVSNESELMKSNASFLQQYLKEITGLKLEMTAEDRSENIIVLETELENSNYEAYNLLITPQKIRINGVKENGVFYGIQTLRKSVNVDFYNSSISFPAVSITDYPRFGYRGMMLDVGRRFYSVEFVKGFIDMLALHNMNVFHWHLTEDQGWRIEIKSYPKLTEIGSIRKQAVVNKETGSFEETGEMYGPYFYTQEEVKDVVDYAKKQFVTIVPEIDLPGHMLAALASYPELGCDGGPYEVAVKRGVFEDVLCVGNDLTFQFLENVFDEIIELFPSKYIHIGGDECPKSRWKECPRCQSRVKQLGLKGDAEHSIEDELQSYFVARVEEYLNSKGRSIIGWDEILEGGLAPNATVMSWRGTEGGIAAAKMNHDVIMTPSPYMYFDYYQNKDVENEPLSIGNYTPLEKVYNYEPIPTELTKAESKHIKGVQANVWTEYIDNGDLIYYMITPRIDALAEVQWTVPENKNYSRFLKRLQNMLKYYDMHDINYSRHLYDVNCKTETSEKSIYVELSTIDNAAIYYTVNGDVPTIKSIKYTSPLQIKESCSVKAVAIRDGEISNLMTRRFNINKATNKAIDLREKPSSRFEFGGAETLVDGILGNENYTDGTWIGFFGTDVDALIDLGAEMMISSVEVGTFIRLDNRVFGARGLSVFVSEDGEEFIEVSENIYPIAEQNNKIGRKDIKSEFPPIKARYVRVLVSRTTTIPEWHISKGGTPLLFIDEICIN